VSDERTRVEYVRALLALIAADDVITPVEIVKLYEVFTALEIPPQDRLPLVQQAADTSPSDPPVELPVSITDDPELAAALAHDAIFIDESNEGGVTADAVAALLRRLVLTPAQIDVIRRWVHLENEILRRLGAGEEWNADSTAKEISARAAAVGLPLTALYYAGVTGFGAAGLTSGLAGLGAVSGLTALGLNPMTAGIAALIVGGITVKKVADFALGSRDRKALLARIQASQALRVRAATGLAADRATLVASGSDRSELIAVMAGGLAIVEARVEEE